MIASAVAALTAGVFAKDICTVDEVDGCQAYDISIKLKTLAPKTLKCKGGDSCKGKTQECVSYYKNGTRNIKGILWNCKSQCDLRDAMLVLWRTDKNFKNAIAVDDNYFGIDGKTYSAMPLKDLVAIDDNVGIESAWRYEKKGDKVSFWWELDGAEEAYWDKKADAWDKEVHAKDADGNDVDAELSEYYLTFAGFGSFDKKNERIKNVSGGVAGCVTGDPTIQFCDYTYAGLVELCDDFDAVCDDLVEGSGAELFAAYGTWKMKFSKKIAGGTKSIASYLPAFAK
jgi:hypothetical protein